MSSPHPTTSKDQNDTNHTGGNKMNVDDIRPCHICNIEIPTIYLKEHKNSEKHLTLSKLADHAFQRILKQMKVSEERDCSASNDSSIHYCDICNIGVEKTFKETHKNDLKHITAAKRDKLIANLLKIYTDTSTLIQPSDQNMSIKSQDISNKAVTESAERDIKTNKPDNIEQCDEHDGNKNEEVNIKKNNASELLNKKDINQDDSTSRPKYTEFVNQTNKSKLNITKNTDQNKNPSNTVQDNNSVIAERNEEEIKNNKTKNMDKSIAKTQINQENSKKVCRNQTNDTDVQYIPKDDLLTAQNLEPQTSSKFKAEAIDEDFIKLTTNSGDTYKLPVDNWHSVFYKQGPLPGSKYFDCQVCLKSFQPISCLLSHKASKKHSENLQVSIEDEHCIRKVYNWSHCVLCNVLVIKTEQHIITEKHQNLLKTFSIPKKCDGTESTVITKFNVNQTTEVTENVTTVKKEYNLKGKHTDNNETSWRNKEMSLDEQNEMRPKISQEMLRKNKQDFDKLNASNMSWRNEEAGADLRNKKEPNDESFKGNLGQVNASWRNKEIIADCQMRPGEKPETSVKKPNADKLKREMMKNTEKRFVLVNVNETNWRNEEKDLHNEIKSNAKEMTVKTTDNIAKKKQIMTSIREDFAKLNANNYNLVQDPIVQVSCDKNPERSPRTELLKITEVKTMNGDVLKVAQMNWHGLIMDNYGHSGTNCLICERFVPEDELQAHIESTQHANKIKVPIDNGDSLRMISYNEAHCILCNEILFDFTREDLETHVLSNSHVRFLNGALVKN